MKLNIILSLFILSFFISCTNDDDDNQDTCIDESKIDELGLCIEIYQPVCGCDVKLIQIYVMLVLLRSYFFH